MTETQKPHDSRAAGSENEPVSRAPPTETARNSYADLFGFFSPDLFEGFEEFVKKSRERSANRREPPPWW
jgi:hypothetical protein